MNYDEAARELLTLLAKAQDGLKLDSDPLGAYARTAAALEEAGGVHTEALLGALAAFVKAQEAAEAQAAGPVSATPAGAPLQPLPAQTASARADFPLSAEQLEVLLPAHVPNDGWDRWYVESDEGGDGTFTLRYYRNASGYCFFVATVEPAEEGYVVGEVVVNQDDKQYSENNLDACVAQLKILLCNDLGLDDEPYWDALDY